jgi:hypothetical protein
MKKFFFCILKVTIRKESDPELDPDSKPKPDPLVRGKDPHHNVTDPQHW